MNTAAFTAPSKAVFDAMLSFYRRTLDIVLRHQPITLGVFFATMAHDRRHAGTTRRRASSRSRTSASSTAYRRASQDISPQEMMRLQRRGRRGHAARSGGARRGSQIGSTFGAQTDEHRAFQRRPQAARGARSRRLAGHRPPASATRQDHRRDGLSPARPGHHGRAAASPAPHFSTRCRIPTSPSSPNGRRSCSTRCGPCRRSSTSAPIFSSSAPQLKVTINRDQASRFGISAQAIDDTLNDAYGQRQITQYFTQLNTYWIILEILPEMQTTLESLDRIYVKSPLTGAAVPLSRAGRCRFLQDRAAVDQSPGPVPGGDA